jgi:hypothetical protein
VNTLRLTGLIRNDTRFWVQRAANIYSEASWLPCWLAAPTQALAGEARENINSLRFVGPHCPLHPSLVAWGLTIAFLLFVSPRLAVALVRLFLACHTLRLDPYRAIAHGVTLVFGAGVAIAIGFALGAPWN